MTKGIIFRLNFSHSPSARFIIPSEKLVFAPYGLPPPENLFFMATPLDVIDFIKILKQPITAEF